MHHLNIYILTVRKHLPAAELTDVSIEFISEALLAVSKGTVVITFGNLPHVCVHRHSLSFVQRHQTHTVCHLQGGNTHSNHWGQCCQLSNLLAKSGDFTSCLCDFKETFLVTFWTANSGFPFWGVGNTDRGRIAFQKTSEVFSHLTLVPTPGRVRSASRACAYGTVRRPSSHCIPWVSWICFALCCRNRALYPKPRSLRRASTLLPVNYNVISNTATVMACMYFMLDFINCN